MPEHNDPGLGQFVRLQAGEAKVLFAGSWLIMKCSAQRGLGVPFGALMPTAARAASATVGYFAGSE